MNNTTKGEWIAVGTSVSCKDKTIAIMDLPLSGKLSWLHEAEANASLIALAGNLAQKYQLDKLEAATEKLRNAWETKDDDMIAFAVEDFLRAITRQPAGEKTNDNANS